MSVDNIVFDLLRVIIVGVYELNFAFIRISAFEEGWSLACRIGGKSVSALGIGLDTGLFKETGRARFVELNSETEQKTGFPAPDFPIGIPDLPAAFEPMEWVFGGCFCK